MNRNDVRIRLLLFAAGLLLGAMSVPDGEHVVTAAQDETLEQAVRRNVAAVLETRHGARVGDVSTDVAWVAPPTGALNVWDAVEHQVFVALARPAGASERDLFRLEARVTEYGRIFDVRRIVNLTRTQRADDAGLVVRGTRVASAVRFGGRVVGFDVRDLAGEDPARVGTQDWGFWRRLGDAVTNLEQTGATRGADFDHYVVEGPSPARVRLTLTEATLEVRKPDSDEPIASIDLQTRESSGPLALSHHPPVLKQRYQALNWLADRGRGLSDRGLLPQWAGSSIELMKEVYFEAKEVQASIAEIRTAEPVVVEDDSVVEEAVERARFQSQESSLPWPPAPLSPLLDERARGEGLWEEVGTDRVTHQPNAPPPFYRTWLRAEPDYPTKRVQIVVWDPEQVQLLMRAGTHEPEPQTAHKGDGRIPRDREHLERVVGGFNGGFQTSHIWYGMMVDRKVLLRGREKGATMGAWEDGRTAFGTWKPYGKIPKGLTHFRQNLTPLVEDGVFNPYRRSKFGWHRHVAGAEDGKTVRTAACATTNGYVMFFFSEFSTANRLGEILIHAGCTYGVHLDMNSGHTGFEWYRQLSADEPTPEAGVFTYEAPVDLRMAGTSLDANATHMEAPVRYLGVDYRDFFYLRLRHVVPGPDLAGWDEDAPVVPWQVASLPHNAEFPPRLATARIDGPDGGSIRILQMDPRALRFEPPGPDGALPWSRDTLIATIPVGAVPDPNPGAADAVRAEPLVVGGVQIHGATPQSAPSRRMEEATIWGTDRHGFVWLATVRNMPLDWVFQRLKQRGVTPHVWTTAPSSGPAEVAMYQPTRNEAGQDALVRVPLGSVEGEVVFSPASDVPRLVVSARPRAPRIVRLFPEMKAKSSGAKGRKTP